MENLYGVHIIIITCVKYQAIIEFEVGLGVYSLFNLIH